jgi:hypothetical protein
MLSAYNGSVSQGKHPRVEATKTRNNTNCIWKLLFVWVKNGMKFKFSTILHSERLESLGQTRATCSNDSEG